MSAGPAWDYETLILDPREDHEARLEPYFRQGFEVLHRYYVPGQPYRFLLGRRRSEGRPGFPSRST